MITAIAIENFKGVRERVEFQLKPLTLLFGANSAGKSTVLHALQYAREVFLHHNLDADRTGVGGDFVELGGFGSFVYDHDLQRTVWLRLELTGDEELQRSLATRPQNDQLCEVDEHLGFPAQRGLRQVL